MEEDSDNTLARVLGGNLALATLRLGIYLVVASAIAATIVTLVR